MIEISNLPPPYDYVKDELNVYTFYTISGAKYIAYFIEEHSFETCKVYSFSFEKEEEGLKKIHDQRISTTIAKIIKDFFLKNNDSLIYTCDSIDYKHRYRNILFKKWFKLYNSQKKYIVHNNEKDDLIMAIIIEKGNPLKSTIFEEFDEFFSYLEG